MAFLCIGRSYVKSPKMLQEIDNKNIEKYKKLQEIILSEIWFDRCCHSLKQVSDRKINLPDLNR